MGKQFLVGAAIGALLVALPFSIFSAATYDPSFYQFTPRDLHGSGHDPQSALGAALDGLGYGALVGAVVGGVIGAVVRAFFRRTQKAGVMPTASTQS